MVLGKRLAKIVNRKASPKLLDLLEETQEYNEISTGLK